jgi:hypothetical protein
MAKIDGQIDGKKVRVRGEVQFRGGGYYIGWNRMCRALIAPALGSTPREDPRYVVYHPGLWFVTICQGGHFFIGNTTATENISLYVDANAFQWRRQRTDRLWVNHPYLMAEDYPPGDPFALPGRYDGETHRLALEESGYVYLIGAESLDRVRIGWTTDPGRRPGELVRSSPVPLSYLALLPATQEDEGWLQHRFRHLNVHDDWFQLSAEILAFIEWTKTHWRKPGEDPVVHLPKDYPPVGADGVQYNYD